MVAHALAIGLTIGGHRDKDVPARNPAFASAILFPAEALFASNLNTGSAEVSAAVRLGIRMCRKKTVDRSKGEEKLHFCRSLQIYLSRDI